MTVIIPAAHLFAMIDGWTLLYAAASGGLFMLCQPWMRW